ncbi:MAG: phosphate ABC transporter permease PstA [Halofilum sp. (in: g-proteobacteria)]|nr:phosphate ABC transporter permease PstA [Halofilum sp. (in: g-proteobacteria)]
MNAHDQDTAVFQEDTVLTGLIRRNKRMDLVFMVLGLCVLLIASTMLISLILGLLVQGAGVVDVQFLTSFPSRKPEEAGILSAWVGTSAIMVVTAFLALPLGVGAGMYLEEYAPKNWVTDLIEINVTNLAGVPSIIYGLLALGLFLFTFGMGQWVVVAGLVLALLILPVVIVATREAFRSIPLEVREGAYALGANQWQTVSGYLLPGARPGILTGLIVGMSRAIGETAPVITIGALTFIAFLPPAPVQAEFPYLSFEWLTSPFTVMPIQMFNWISRPQSEFHDLAAGAGLVLLLMTLLMNGLAIYIRYRLRKVKRR